HLGGVIGLLVRDHQEFQRVFFHHAIGVLLQKSLQAADLCVGIGLLDRSHVSVVLGRILDLFFLLGLTGCLTGLSGRLTGLGGGLARLCGLLGRWLLGSSRLRLRLRCPLVEYHRSQYKHNRNEHLLHAYAPENSRETLNSGNYVTTSGLPSSHPESQRRSVATAHATGTGA